MKLRSFLVLSAVCLAAAITTAASPPGLLNYQGRVLAGGTNFNGTGQFKFVLTDGAGTASFWSNDGTSSGGGQPAAAVSLPVVNGLFSVVLGDPATGGMANIPANVFLSADVRVRVWFNDGATGFQLLTPDRRITASGYALVSSTVPDGSITAEKLAPGVGVAGGGLVASTSYQDPTLIAAGYSVFGGPQYSGDVWTKRGSNGQPPSRTTAATGAIWIGSEMFFWGDYTTPGGARYNPQTGIWTTLPSTVPNAPSRRSNYTCVWTGTREGGTRAARRKPEALREEADSDWRV